MDRSEDRTMQEPPSAGGGEILILFAILWIRTWKCMLLCCFWLTRLCDSVDQVDLSGLTSTHREFDECSPIKRLCHVPCAVCQDILEDVLGGGNGMGHDCKGNWE